jgi:hypothetical protein
MGLLKCTAVCRVSRFGEREKPSTPLVQSAVSPFHGRMVRGGLGLPKVSPGTAMPDLSTPCRCATPETALQPFQEWAGSLRPTSTLLDTQRHPPMVLPFCQFQHGESAVDVVFSGCDVGAGGDEAHRRLQFRRLDGKQKMDESRRRNRGKKPKLHGRMAWGGHGLP